MTQSVENPRTVISVDTGLSSQAQQAQGQPPACGTQTREHTQTHIWPGWQGVGEGFMAPTLTLAPRELVKLSCACICFM